MVHLVNVHGSDGVRRTDEFGFFVPRQVTAIEKSERAKFKDQANAIGIVGGILGLLDALATGWISLGGVALCKLLTRGDATQGRLSSQRNALADLDDMSFADFHFTIGLACG